MLLFISGCKPGIKVTQNLEGQAPLIIYKTSGDYLNNIPVTMDKSKTNIIGYPAVSDIREGGKRTKPQKLAKGFLLDNFGINPQTVFTSYNFEEYSKLEKTPSLKELMEKLSDPDAITEMYDCGKRSDFKTIEEINDFIRNHFDQCKKIK